MKNRFLAIISVALLYFSALGQDTIRSMSYNLLDFPSQASYRVDTLKKIIDYTLPDIFMVCELESQTGANSILNNALNVGGRTNYAQTPYVNGPDTDNLIFYNSDKIGFKSYHVISTSLRNINEYVLFYKSPDIATTTDTTFFYCYVAHLKASSGYENQRYQETVNFRNYFNTRYNAENVLLGGDFNLYDDSEPALNEIMNNGTIQLNDPVNLIGSWHNNSAFVNVHTQSTRYSTGLAGGSSGGLDDRFDFIFISDDLFSGSHKAKYISGSYKALGQDGQHFNDAVNYGGNNAVPDWVANALFYMSDHLPVIMDVEVGGTVNIQENQSFVDSYIYQNESNSIQIKMNESQADLILKVFDISGKQVYFKRFMSVKEINEYLPELNTGMYIIQLSSGENTSSMKFMK